MLAGVVIVLTVALSATVPYVLTECSDSIRQTVGCPTVSGSVDGDDVVLRGSEEEGGAHVVPGDDDSASGSGTTAPTAPTVPSCAFTGPAVDLCWITAAGDPAVQGGPVTLADIASFRPRADVDNMEPDGWAIVGLHTNFFADGGAQVVDGVLLGQSASVRFTPVGWRWDYGDGVSASHPFPGAPWAAQGIPEFDPTGTSHVYRQYGQYRIDLTVTYAAEYRFAGGPWLGIAGTVALPADPLSIAVGDAKTVLVQRECTRNPAGPGC